MQEDDDLLTIESFLSDYRERDWIKDAACRGMDTDIFFPERGDVLAIKKAKTICDGCKVSKECLEYGDSEKFGLWGGLSPMPRRRLRITRKQQGL